MSPDSDRPLALAAYEELAGEYAKRVATKPFNADLERPATRSLLPDLDGLDVLDAGCGPGVTTAELLAGGANVVAADVSPRMLEHARARVGNEAEFVRLDLGQPLPVRNDLFDLVHSSLAVTYVRNWSSLFAEFGRILHRGGHLVFSTQHPFDDAQRLDPDDYFETERVSETWDGFGDPVETSFYRRPLGAVLNPLLDAGLRLERVTETQPTERFREKKPDVYERISGKPTFLALRARSVEWTG